MAISCIFQYVSCFSLENIPEYRISRCLVSKCSNLGDFSFPKPFYQFTCPFKRDYMEAHLLQQSLISVSVMFANYMCDEFLGEITKIIINPCFQDPENYRIAIFYPGSSFCHCLSFSLVSTQ